MKLIVRADDVGYTDVCNIGAFETIYRGVTTAADLMLDTPGAPDAMRRLRELPWISVGWHAHFWGSPLSHPSEIPTLVDPATGHFRQDLNRAADVSEAECLLEMHAQMKRCIELMGRAPDTGMTGMDSPFGRAMNQIMEAYGIVHGFAWQKPFFFQQGTDRSYRAPARYADRQIYMLLPGETTDQMVRASQLEEHVKYDPLVELLSGELTRELPAEATAAFVLHPGYVDDYVCRDGDQGPGAAHYLLVRPLDVRALCSQAIRDWVCEQGVELCSFTDALYGRRQYQNHLRAVGSPLAVD